MKRSTLLLLLVSGWLTLTACAGGVANAPSPERALVTAVPNQAPPAVIPPASHTETTNLVTDSSIETAVPPRPNARAFVIDSAHSSAGYAVREEFFAGAVENLGQLLGLQTTVGVTQGVSGELTVIADGALPQLLSGVFEVDLRGLASDSVRRDDDVRYDYLNTDSFPVAIFVARQIAPLDANEFTIEGNVLRFVLAGDLTVREITVPVTFDVAASLDGPQLQAVATTNVRLSQFGITAPNFANFLAVADEMTIHVEILAHETSQLSAVTP